MEGPGDAVVGVDMGPVDVVKTGHDLHGGVTVETGSVDVDGVLQTVVYEMGVFVVLVSTAVSTAVVVVVSIGMFELEVTVFSSVV